MNGIFRLPLIAILRGIRPEEVLAHIDALVGEGYDAIEIPTNSPDWEKSVGLAVAAYGERTMIGAGTVVRERQVDALAKLGGRLMVTPNTNPTLIRRAIDCKLTVAAGCATASEAFAAVDAGAHMLKLFPATTYGTGHVRSLRSVLPPVPLFVVGGITPQNLGEYLQAGATGAGIGGELYRAGQSIARTRVHASAFRESFENFNK